MIVLLLLAGFAAAAAVYLTVGELSRPAAQRRTALALVRGYRRPAATAPRRRRRSPAVGRIEQRLAHASLRLGVRRSESAVTSQLVAAGLGGRVSTVGFLAFELMAGVAAALAALLLSFWAGRSPDAIALLGVSAGAAGFLTPRLVVRARSRRRVERIVQALPDGLDLLAVAVSAGLGLEAALAKLVESMSGPLAEELALVLMETRMGASRQEAFGRMAGRLDAADVHTVVRSLVQGEQLGVSLGETLRTQAGEARRRRRAVSEERASKAPVKMLFPTALFIFPALFVVVLAPALLELGSMFH